MGPAHRRLRRRPFGGTSLLFAPHSATIAGGIFGPFLFEFRNSLDSGRLAPHSQSPTKACPTIFHGKILEKKWKKNSKKVVIDGNWGSMEADEEAQEGHFLSSTLPIGGGASSAVNSPLRRQQIDVKTQKIGGKY